MKRITIKPIHITIVSLVAIVLPACDNRLEETIYSDVPEQSYTYTDAYEAMGIVYANMRGMMGHQNYYMVQETSADAIVMPANASGWDDGGIYRRIHLHSWNSENPQMNNMWNSYYTGVLNANRIIEQIESGMVPVPAETSMDALVSEMRVARAFFYWLLIDNFGDVPLVAEVTRELPVSTPREEVYQFIEAEINQSMPHLSEETGQPMYGRFNKWAAKALLANVYLNAQVYTGEAAWPACISECNDIIGKYELEENYRNIFQTANEGSREIIFAIPFDEINASGFWAHMFSWHAALRNKVNMQDTPWGSGSAMGVPQFIDTYDPDDGRLEDAWLMGPQYAADGTTPLNGNYDQAGKPLVFTKDLPDGVYTGEAEGYRMNKFEVKTGARFNLSNDFPFFRYAQVLLMKAECLLRTGNSGEAAELVTQVRMRAFKDDPEKAVVTGAELEEDTRYQYGYVEDYQITDPGNTAPVQYGRLYDELGWEFSWEAHRRRDMIRFGIFTQKSWLSHEPNGDYRTVFPVPQLAVDTNPDLSQNEEY